MANEDKSLQKVPQIGVFTTPKTRKGVYANTLQVTISPADVTMDFVYLNHNDQPNGTLMSRVIVSRKTATMIAETLKQAVAAANEVNPE